MFNVNDTNYVSLAVRTEAPTDTASRRLQDAGLLTALENSIGVAVDRAAILDMLKKAIFYGKGVVAHLSVDEWTPQMKAARERLQDVQIVRLLHGSLGIATESGELLEAIHGHVFGGKPLDFPNICEELGDLLWYIAILCDACHYPLQEVMGRNIAKLRARYPDKFTEDAAINRNLTEERATLTDGTDSNTNGGQPTNG